MKILYDISATQPTSARYHGGGEYGKVVFKRLLQRRTSEEIVGFWDPNLWLDPEVECLIEDEDIDLISRSDDKTLEERTGNYDIFYSSLPYNYEDISLGNLKTIITIHGLRPIECPTDRYESRFNNGYLDKCKALIKYYFQDEYIRYYSRRFSDLVTAQREKKIIVVPSEHTKYAIMDEYDSIDEGEVRVLYSPVRHKGKVSDIDVLRDEGIVSEKYILMVSGGRWIKNSYRAVKALDTLFERRSELDLDVVITGVENPDSIFGELSNPARFQFLDYVERSVLEGLYKHAYCLLYPTLNEGFGYPPIEAMRYGTPVLCSAVTSLPEICQDAALYFNPYSVREIRNRVLMLSKDEQVHHEYEERARDRYSVVVQQQNRMLDDLCDLILAA